MSMAFGSATSSSIGRIRRKCAAYLQIRRSMERHSRAEEFPSGLCAASIGAMICCMACSRKLSSREATGTLLKTGRRYLCRVYE